MGNSLDNACRKPFGRVITDSYDETQFQMKCGSPRLRTLTGRSMPICPARDNSAEPDAFLML
ncbi:MAG: hypothetical protein ACW975_11910 [Candidatus Thorarchaeota archaeon]